MDFTGGIGRPIVQYKERPAFAGFQDALVDVSAVPGFELLGLVLGQAGLHGKVGFGQVQCLLEFEWFGHSVERSDIPSLPVLPSVCPGARRETSKGSRTSYVTMKGRWVSAAEGAQPFRAYGNPISEGYQRRGGSVYT